jgi:hypothetical protein
MACEQFRDALTDVAAGGPAPAGALAHLAVCEACRMELDTLRRALATADAELAERLSAEPSPGLAARIRRAVAEAEDPAARRFGWLWPAVAVTATLLVALVVVAGRSTPPTSGSRLAADAARAEAKGSAPVAPPSGGPVISRDLDGRGPEGSAGPAEASHGEAAAQARADRAPERARLVGRRAKPAEPEVLVPPGEAEAVLLFASHLQGRPVEPGSLLVADLSAPLPEPNALEITPIEFVPLDPAETSGTD